MQALLEFLGMVPELTEAMQDAPGPVLAGCERDCKQLAFKALTFLQQVAHPQTLSLGQFNARLQHVLCDLSTCGVGLNTKGVIEIYSYP